MLEILPLEDMASPPIDDRQARDFANRVMFGIAERVAGKEDDPWHSMQINRYMDHGAYKRHISLGVTFDDMLPGFHYDASVMMTYPFDDEWDPEVVRKLLQVPTITMEIEDGGLVVVRANLEDDDDIYEGEYDETEGYIAFENDYRFTVPDGARWCRYSKILTVSILDEDGDPVDGEVAYAPALNTRRVPVDDLENLYRFGEKLADTPKYEEDMSRVTRSDLNFLLDAFKKVGLVREDCKPLSSKVL